MTTTTASANVVSKSERKQERWFKYLRYLKSKNSWIVLHGRDFSTKSAETIWQKRMLRERNREYFDTLYRNCRNLAVHELGRHRPWEDPTKLGEYIRSKRQVLTFGYFFSDGNPIY